MTYTVYTKSNCNFCSMVKELLSENEVPFVLINCDALIENETDKAAFLDKMEKKIGKPYKTFPMVFLNDTFVGGLIETLKSFN